MASLLGPLRTAAHRAPTAWLPVAGPSTRRHLSNKRQRVNSQALADLDTSLNEEVLSMYEKANATARTSKTDKMTAYSADQQLTWHARPYKRIRRLLTALVSGRLEGKDYRRLLFTLRQDFLHGIWHPQRSAQQIGAGLIGLVTLSARAKALSTFWSRRIFYADVDETYRLYLRALATGDVEALRWRASTPFMRSLTDRIAKQRPGYRIVGPIIHEEHSVKPRIVHTMPTSGQFQVTVRFRTTQSLQVFDDKGDFRPELSSEKVPVLQYFVFQQLFDSENNPTSGWRMYAETFEPASILDVEAIEAKNPHGPSPMPLVFTHDGPWQLSIWERFVKWWDASVRGGPPKPSVVREEPKLVARGL